MAEGASKDSKTFDTSKIATKDFSGVGRDGAEKDATTFTHESVGKGLKPKSY